ncbi:MAG: ATP-binding cassette domain-containing protein, partial [Pseudomonadota bacterium]
KNDRGPFQVLFYNYDAEDQQKVREIAEEIGLISEIGRQAGQLSHGQKQWLEIGMLLAQEPHLLMVDEPAAGMTTDERKKTVQLLKRMAQSHAVIVVEHDMEFVRELECRVTVLHEGAVLAEGSLDYVTNNQEVIDVYLGR